MCCGTLYDVQWLDNSGGPGQCAPISATGPQCGCGVTGVACAENNRAAKGSSASSTRAASRTGRGATVRTTAADRSLARRAESARASLRGARASGTPTAAEATSAIRTRSGVPLRRPKPMQALMRPTVVAEWVDVRAGWRLVVMDGRHRRCSLGSSCWALHDACVALRRHTREEREGCTHAGVTDGERRAAGEAEHIEVGEGAAAKRYGRMLVDAGQSVSDLYPPSGA